MLKNDVAQARLAEWKAENPTERIVGEFKKLDDKLRPIAFGLMNCNADGKERDPLDFDLGGQWHDMIEERYRQFDSLPSTDRLAILVGLFGPFGVHVDRGWEFMKSALASEFGDSFRAPNNPALTLKSRHHWLYWIIEPLKPFNPEVVTPEWLAIWAPYVAPHSQETVGRLLASIIDSGGKDGDAVFQVLSDSVTGRHEIGSMGRHVTHGLLECSRPDAWELMEKTLLAAQRQEGLRQVLLESIHEAHPDAFKRMLKLIAEHKLARFSSVTKALNDWLGYRWDSVSVGVVNKTIETLASFIGDPDARKKAIDGTDAEEAYLALWTTSLEDVEKTPPLAEKLLGHKKVEMRFAAVSHLANASIPDTFAGRIRALGDEDVRVAVLGAWSLNEKRENERTAADPQMFELVEKLMSRIGEDGVQTKPLIWPWTGRKIEREDVYHLLLVSLGSRDPARLIPHLDAFKYGPSSALELIVKDKSRVAETKPALLDLIETSSEKVRTATVTAMKDVDLDDGDLERLEKLLLSKKGQGVRRDVCTLIHRQKDDGLVFRSVDRLLSCKDGSQRLAGLMIAREGIRQKRGCKPLLFNRVQEYVQSKGGPAKLPKDELIHWEAIQSADESKPSLENALGLADLSGRSQVPMLKMHDVQFMTEAAFECLKSLDDLIHEHRETSIKFKQWNDEETEQLLGTMTYGFPAFERSMTIEENRGRLPLLDVWENWLADRPAGMRDKDGFEIVRAEQYFELVNSWKYFKVDKWAKENPGRKEFFERFCGGCEKPSLKYDSIVEKLLRWFALLQPPMAVLPFLFDAAETSFASVPIEDHEALLPKPGEVDDDKKKAMGYGYGDPTEWRDAHLFEHWFDRLSSEVAFKADELSDADRKRYWGLQRFLDEPIPGAKRRRPYWTDYRSAYDVGAATFADVADCLLGPRVQERFSSWSGQFSAFGELTEKKVTKENREFLELHPEVAEFVDKARERILELELARSDTPTAATEVVKNLGSLYGVETLFRVLKVIGKDGFKVGARFSYREVAASKVETLTSIAKVVFPLEGDTQERFTALAKECVKEYGFKEQSLLELMFLAPQWATFVEKHFGWPGLSEGLYWFLAHMKYINADAETAASSAGYSADNADAKEEGESEPKEKKSAWDRLIAERTPLTDAERKAGAIDVGWFRRTYDVLKAKRWESLAAAARFAANSAQARKAKYLGEILLGTAKKKDLVDGIKKKFLKDSVRLLGLLPLAAGAKRDADLADRYKTLVEYRRYAKGLSSMSKPAAMEALDVGMKNLASIAGNTDPLRLEWAMEADAVADLAKGPVSATKDGVTVTLSLDDLGRPNTSVTKAGKELKSVPPAVKKDPKIVAVTERVADLKRQASRVKESLEKAMCRGDAFTAAELLQLAEHAVLWPQLSRLVLVGEGILGYPDKMGKALRNHAGKLEPIKKKESLRIAHPHDLFETGEWSKWQHDCFAAERVQPFKQVFRELYLVTGQEKKDKTKSLRYAAQQVNPSQAIALWNARNWTTNDGVYKVFHDEGITATVDFNRGYTTPLEVEGWTFDAVSFTKRDEWKPMPLTEVPARVFSETMRDLDLVVSVAHRGGVDPEASASTVEMRASLLRETCSLLKIKNVKVKEPHVVINGSLSEYSVHLGSANVHRMPGGSLCIVPVHSQHRGRLFLPFADDDPRTAEVVSKVILLAKDEEIQDPIVLDQLRR